MTRGPTGASQAAGAPCVHEVRLSLPVNILIVKPSSLGDIVHTLPAVDLIRRRYPDAFIAWVVNDTFTGLLDLYPGIDEVITFRRKRWGRLRHWHEIIGFVGDLRQHHFDVVLDFQGLFRSGFISYTSAAPRRVGFHGSREGSSFFYTERVAVPANLKHAVERNVFLVRSSLDIGAESPMPELLRPHDFVKEAKRLLKQHDLLSGGGPLLAVGSGARWPSKRWPPRFFAAVLDSVQESLPDLRSWLLGTADETANAEQVIGLCRASRPRNLAGQTTLGSLGELLRRSDALLTNDSGPMHLAAAMSVPTIALFGPTDPDLTGPYGEQHSVFRSSCQRAPCFLRECDTDKRLCADGMSVSEVAEAVVAKLEWSRQQRHHTTVTHFEEESP